MNAVCIVTLLSLLGWALPAAAADNPRDWLADMNTAFSELSYDGVFSFYSGSDLASLRIVHMVVEGEQRERLVHLNGAPREIIRTGEDVACIMMPGDELLEIESNIPAGPFSRAFVRRYDQISNHYSFDFFGEDRIAGRTAVRLAVSPLDEDRFGYRLWLDKETRLLLRSELVDADGQRLEIFQFNTLELGDQVSQQALEPADYQGEIRSHLALASLPSLPVSEPDVEWSAGWIPAGFTMAAADVRRRPDDLASINTMMYSDGLAAFSVFIEDMPSSGASSMVSREGATVAVTRLTSGPLTQQYLVTIVGELPTTTAMRIADSVQFRQQP
jgi:sigma-E factor negative regulatory protein RseB